MRGRTPNHRAKPAGASGYLTRKQAAALLGFASEFKIRQLERDGAIHSVRGPMQTAFYARAEILALRARLALVDPNRARKDEWSDSDLLALLCHPGQTGRPRTVLDLVLETQISIERAERVFAFWQQWSSQVPALSQPDGRRAVEPRDEHGQDNERRGVERIARDALIQELRDPDPKIRERAFIRLRESRTP